MQNEPQLPIAPCYQSLFLLLTGAITVRLVSCEFEADTQHGEHANLCKTEADFRGREFEMQFACRFKVSFK